MATFTEQEAAFLGTEGIGRLATLSASGAPALAAVRYHIQEAEDGSTLVVIPGYGMRHSAKFHNVGRDGRVAFLIDGSGSGSGPHSVQFIQMRGQAKAVNDDEGARIVLTPERIISFNLNEQYSVDEEPAYDSRDIGGERTIRRLQA